jgi:hypothetical protein
MRTVVPFALRASSGTTDRAARLIETGGVPGDAMPGTYAELVRGTDARWLALVRASGVRAK